MNGNSSWLRRLGSQIKTGTQRFMHGRYGTDKLNSLILSIGLVFCIVSMFMPIGWANLMMAGLAYVCMGVAIFRSLSRNTYKRYRENRQYLSFMERLKDRDHRYFACPKCRQNIRVPKGKGKIAITCPKCREKFIKKT